MYVNGKKYRSIWEEADKVMVIDQRLLPHRFEIVELSHLDDFVIAIKDMIVRGAPLIGITAAFGVHYALKYSHDHDFKQIAFDAAHKLKSTRPTAINLAWAVDQLLEIINISSNQTDAIKLTQQHIQKLIDDDLIENYQIGVNGVQLIKKLHQKLNRPVNILTHCNAGWLACVDYGTATSPMYFAYEEKIPIHIWVDETRPRNQGASLTAWELGQAGIPHKVIVDNAGGLLMMKNMVDLVIVGADRVTKSGYVFNKIGTYLKALAAKDQSIPFYVAVPQSTFDFTISDEIESINIEERNTNEVTHISGWDEANDELRTVRITPKNTNVSNFGFDITPPELITAFITNKGICKPNINEITQLI